MVPEEYYEDEYYEDEYDEEIEGEEDHFIPAWLRETPYWAVSALLHVVLFAILLVIFTDPPSIKEDQVPINIKPIPKKEDKYDPTVKRDMKKTKKILHEKQVDKPIIERQLEEVTPDIPKGTSLDNVTNVELLSDNLNDAIGVGGGAAGAYGERWGKGSLINEGGGAGTEAAVRAALEWLRRHQRADGGWSAENFAPECDGVKGGNKDSGRYPTDKGFKNHDVGVTGLAILAFAGFGHTHLDGKYPEYVEVLRKAVKYMKSKQIKSADKTLNGTYGDRGVDAEGNELNEHWIYDHSIATMAMGELLAMSDDKINLEKSVTDAVKLCLLAQNTGYGWKYAVKEGKNDTSVTGWMVLALKTAKNAGLKIPRAHYKKAFDGALKWFDRATSVASGKTGYEVPGDEGSRLAGYYPDDPYPYSKDLSCMTAVAVLCRLFSGESRTDPVIKRGVDILMAHKPQWREQDGKKLSTINIYYWYYASYAMFQFGGKMWEDWNKDMIEALVSTQRQEFDPETKEPHCVDGSWDPIGEWGIAGGRVYSTAIGAMTLEVYYRFTRANEGIGN